jgi:hypothetical protein
MGYVQKLMKEPSRTYQMWGNPRLLINAAIEVAKAS